MLEVILDTETTGLSNKEKHRIIEKFKKLQLPVELKKKQADYIIKNNFKNNSTKKHVKKIVKKILLNA